MQRGGRPELETRHGQILLASGAADVWGWGSPAGQERVRRRVDWLRTCCDMKPGVRVLECGCGTGIFTRELAKTGAEITAVDISPDLLNRARQECPDNNVTFVQANLEDPVELEDNNFDVLCGVSVLHHLVLPKALIALRPKLRQHAKFAFSEPNLLNPLNRWYFFVRDPVKREQRGTSPSEMAFRPRELEGYFQAAGYNPTALRHRDFMHPAVPRAVIGLVKSIERLCESLPLIRAICGSLWIEGKVQ